MSRKLKSVLSQSLHGYLTYRSVPKDECEQIAAHLIDEMCSAIVNEGGFESRGKLGKFAVVEQKARRGHNPKTGEVITIPAKRTVRYHPGSQIRDALKATDNQADTASN